MSADPFEPKHLQEHWSIHWEEVLQVNETIGQVLGFRPVEEFYAGTAGSSAYSPAMCGVHHPADQRQEVDEWLAHLRTLGNTQYSRQHQLHWPAFHADWNALMEAIVRLVRKPNGWPYVISTERYWMWVFVAHECGVTDVTDRVPSPTVPAVSVRVTASDG